MNDTVVGYKIIESIDALTKAITELSVKVKRLTNKPLITQDTIDRVYDPEMMAKILKKRK